MTQKTLSTIAIILLVSWLHDVSHSQTITGLGDLPGGSIASSAFAISGDGSTITGKSDNANGDQAFIWTAEDGIQSLGFVPSGFQSEGIGISQDGAHIVGLIDSIQALQAFRWNGGEFVPLEQLNSESAGSAAMATSMDGSVNVGYSNNFNGVDRAVRWTDFDDINQLGSLANSFDSSSRSLGVNGDGSVIVGWSENTRGDTEAFVWTSMEGMVGLGDLESGSFESTAYDVTPDGRVIVGYGRTASAFQMAVRWDEVGEIESLGLFPEDSLVRSNNIPEGITPFTSARAVSADGQIVVGRGYGSEVGFSAFVWNTEAGMRSLSSVLCEFEAGDTSWRFEESYDISDDGRKIVGEGVHFSEGNQVTEAFLIDFTNLELRWTTDQTGEWDDLANWLGRLFLPGSSDHVTLNSVNPISVAGPRSPTTVKQVSIAGLSSAQVALNVRPNGPLQVTDLFTVGENGVLRGEGVVSGQELENHGEVQLVDSALLLDMNLVRNSGLIQGSGEFNGVTINEPDGVFRLPQNERMILNGEGNQNSGLVQLLGGTLDVQQSYANGFLGSIVGRGAIFADLGIANMGTMAFSGGFTDIFGNVILDSEGVVITSGFGVTTFYDDVAHNGQEIRTSQGSATVFFGNVTGAGAFTGFGSVFLEGDFQPGNSPAAVLFEGDLDLAASSTVQFEIGGTVSGEEYDQLIVEGNLFVESNLTVVSLNGFIPTAGQQFTIVEVGGTVTGLFADLPEGSLIDFGSSDSVAFRISYAGGDGNDIVLIAEDRCGGSVTDGVLTITTTNGNDVVDVSSTARGIVMASINGCTETYTEVSSVVLNTLSGNDQITASFPGVEIHAGPGNDNITVNSFGQSLIYGDEGDDTIVGGFGADSIFGGEGDDNISGRNGADFIDGGAPPLENPGRNLLNGGPGSDTIVGGLDVDIIIGGDGNDIISGFDGDDEIFGNNGADEIASGGGDDFVSAGLGFDLVLGGPGNDEILGGDGQDQLQGGQGNDVLNGGQGNDVLMGQGDNDVLTGGPGNDLLDGGSGNDTATDEGEQGEVGIENS